MTSTSTSDRIRREARVVGLREFRTPSLEAVERRRLQLWVLMAGLLLAVTAEVVLLSALPERLGASLLRPSVLRTSIILLSVAFTFYAIEKELHLQRLARLLTDERVLTAALTNRLREVSLLLDAGKAMNSVLELPGVLEVILRSATELLEANSGSIMLVDGDELVAASILGNEAARGERLSIGEGIAGRVAATREPLLIDGQADAGMFPGRPDRPPYVESAMSVPLVHRDRLVGVLNVNADRERRFTEYDLRALSLFAEQGAGSIANARLYEGERAHVEELMQLDRMKSDFIDLVSHELRTPISIVLAAAKTAQRPGTEAELPELIEMVERHSLRLAGMVDQLLTAAKLDRGPGSRSFDSVDLAALARVAASEWAVSGVTLQVEANDAVYVCGDPDSLRRILDNLVENATKYGAPPIRVRVASEEGRVLMSVHDRGPGIPPDQRERIFQRFSRLSDHIGKPGLGLGLPIVRGLAAAFGGTVWIGDADEGGTVVCVALPQPVAAEVRR